MTEKPMTKPEEYYYECLMCGSEFMMTEGLPEQCPFCQSKDVGPVEEPEVKR